MKQKYTLGKQYILRCNSKDSYMLFNTSTSIEYDISKEFFYILKIFKYNALSKSHVYNFFKENKIDINIHSFEENLLKPEFSDLLEISDTPNSVNKEIELIGFPFYVDNTPSRIDLLLTERCNLQCKHCFQDSTPTKPLDFPPLDKLIKLFDEFEVLNIKSLKITGGEPLLHPHIKELLQYLATKNYQKSILSNAILINDSIIEIIKNKNFRFGISLDGSTFQNHEFLRGKNTFDKTVTNIKKLRDNGIYFSITTTLHMQNYKDISNICRLVFDDLGARMLNINIIFPLGRGGFGDILCLPEDNIKSLRKEIDILSAKYNNKIIQLNDAEETLPYENNDNLIYCNGGTRTLAISPKFEVYPCTFAFGMQEFMMGKAGDEKIIDIWKKDKWKIFRGDIKLEDLKQCSTCQFNKKCGVKNCRIKPMYEGLDFYSPISYCKLKTIGN